MLDQIRTTRLELRPFSTADRDSLAELLRSEDIKKTYMIPELPDRAALERLTDRLMEISCSEDRLERGIYLRGELIGFVNDVGIQGGTIELGYAIHPAHWGRGYATEMLGAVLAALGKRGFTTARAGAFAENTASLRVMEKCGMQKCPETETIEYRGKEYTCVYYEKTL